MVRAYTAIVEVEEEHFRLLRFFLKQHPIWNEYLVSVKGVGHAMAAVIISEIDIEKATYGSTIWRYAGLDVGPDGRGRSRRKDHLVEYAYKDKDGETQTRKGITFNPFLKTKLIGVLGSSFLRAKGPYSDVYYDYKHRLENSPAHAEKTKGHRHNMAVRYMVKRFLQDLYNAWRPLEGLPAHPEYAEAKLGIVHHKKPPKDDDDRPKV